MPGQWGGPAAAAAAALSAARADLRHSPLEVDETLAIERLKHPQAPENVSCLRSQDLPCYAVRISVVLVVLSRFEAYIDVTASRPRSPNLGAIGLIPDGQAAGRFAYH